MLGAFLPDVFIFQKININDVAVLQVLHYSSFLKNLRGGVFWACLWQRGGSVDDGCLQIGLHTKWGSKRQMPLWLL